MLTRIINGFLRIVQLPPLCPPLVQFFYMPVVLPSQSFHGNYAIHIQVCATLLKTLLKKNKLCIFSHQAVLQPQAVNICVALSKLRISPRVIQVVLLSYYLQTLDSVGEVHLPKFTGTSMSQRVIS